MTVRTVTTICVIAVLVSSVAVAQQASEIEALGESMEIAVEEGDFETAFSNAETIIEAQPDDSASLSAEQQFWVGNAYMVKMAQMLDMAKDELADRGQARFAEAMTEWILSPEIRTISRGEEVALEDYLIDGKTVVFSFFSPYSGESMQMVPAFEALARHRDDVALVKVNINRPDAEQIDLESPVAQQHGIETLPYLKIYGSDGGMQAEGEEAQAMVIGWLQELQAQMEQQQRMQQQQP